MKSIWYPRIHDSKMSFYMTAYPGTNHATICPLVMYDEGKGNPASFNSHPENAGFAEVDEPNCYPDSRLEKISCMVGFQLSKAAIETDKIRNLKVGFMPIFTSFEDLAAKDEVTGETIGTILEMTSEATDRQAYPLWSGTKGGANWTNSDLIPAAVPGLTTNQRIESVAFDLETYYDALHYYTNGSKLKSVQGGITWINLTKNRPFSNILIRLRSKSKSMQQYNFAGVMVLLPKAETFYQPIPTADVTNTSHVLITIKTRYNEWHEHFDHART